MIREQFGVKSAFLMTQLLGLALAVAPAFAGNDKNFTYLALGDSISFGYDPTLFFCPPGQVCPTPTPAQFIGYPEVVAEVEHLLQSKKEVNASCPGETSSSFLSSPTPSTPDNGCNSMGPHGEPPFKTSIGLHTAYAGTQMDFAVSKLASNKHINVVTLGIGGNDLLVLQQRCATNPAPYPTFADCVGANLQGVLQLYAFNLTNILTALRANYKGTLILVTTYSPSADPLFGQAVGALNQALMLVGAPFGAKFADAFTAFKLAATLFPGANGDPCKAGLLIQLSPTTCDVHPSPAGRNLLAATVLSAIGGKQDD